MSYQHVHEGPYPPPGYGPPPPQPQGYPPPGMPPPPGFYGGGGYPPPPPPPGPNSYQGYFNDQYPPPPPQHTYHDQGGSYYYGDDNGCSSFLRGCLATLCCCCLLEECCYGANVVGYNTGQTYTGGYKQKNQLYCDYCKYKGHTRDVCNKLVGYPSDFKPRRKNFGRNATAAHVQMDNCTSPNKQMESAVPAALWLHSLHPKTLACNLESMSNFGYFKDLPEILYRLLEGADVRENAKKEREMRKLNGEPFRLRTLTAFGEPVRFRAQRTFGKPKLSDEEKVEIKKQKRMEMAKKAVERVASVAMELYKYMFLEHDGYRFEEYLEKVKQGKAKIAAGALLPHQIIREVKDWLTDDRVAELQWKRMVDDLSQKGKLKNCLAICDFSGSMWGTPRDVSVALGILVSELSEEPWKGKLITFSENPTLQLVEGEDLRSKDCDMEFDEASANPWETDYEAIVRKFREKGYGNCVPQIVFWNLRDSIATPVSCGCKPERSCTSEWFFQEFAETILGRK
ncbi:hypothetical protein A4A49_17621 [Nicotiana attenuata]|uniref:Uncharacterized protein n=1 Tax=Nicotiana attenuata TaxID=49451 RepID=A0A1J6J3S9_NICAT|nr:hypothetical protein A4A49_17621 [Nicotiana attenuata]